jgi:hypothetical protein
LLADSTGKNRGWTNPAFFILINSVIFETVIAPSYLLNWLPCTGLKYDQNIIFQIQTSYMFTSLMKRFFMPYLSGPACTIPVGCDAPNFPVSTAQCNCTTAVGGINELYFIPCTEVFSETNVTDVAWWQGLITAAKLGRSGLGLGSIGKKSQKNDRVASCRTEQVTLITWALKYGIKCFDKTSARSTCKKLNELVINAHKYLVVARMCDGDNTILPIGLFDTTDVNWTVPDNNEDNQLAEIELSWKELGFPCTVDVAGLNAILPKLS